MPSSPTWTRRTFVRTFGYLAGVTGVTPISLWGSVSKNDSTFGNSTQRFAFVASAAGTISVFSISRSGGWNLTQTVSSQSPISLALSPDQRFLYVANASQTFRNRPSGSVEAYTVDVQTGHLLMLNRQPLALHANTPKHLAISPDGRLLAVAVEGNATYNLLSIAQNGKLNPVTASLKPLIRSMDRAATTPRPQAVFFVTNDTLLAFDAGRRSIVALLIDKDLALLFDPHQKMPHTDAATHIVAHTAFGTSFTAGGDSRFISTISYDPETLSYLRVLQQYQLPSVDGGIAALAMHPQGKLLFAATAEGISVISVDFAGAIQSQDPLSHALAGIQTLTCSPDGHHLLATTSNSVLRIGIDHHQGFLFPATVVAALTAPTAMVLKYA